MQEITPFGPLYLNEKTKLFSFSVVKWLFITHPQRIPRKPVKTLFSKKLCNELLYLPREESEQLIKFPTYKLREPILLYNTLVPGLTGMLRSLGSCVSLIS